MKVYNLCFALSLSVVFLDFSCSVSDHDRSEFTIEFSGKCGGNSMCPNEDPKLKQKLGPECFNEMNDTGKQYFLKSYSETFSRKTGSLQLLQHEICEDAERLDKFFEFFSNLIYRNISSIEDKEEKSDAEKELSLFKVCLQDVVDICVSQVRKLFLHIYIENLTRRHEKSSPSNIKRMKEEEKQKRKNSETRRDPHHKLLKG